MPETTTTEIAAQHVDRKAAELDRYGLSDAADRARQTASTLRDADDAEYVAICPACGSAIDYCQGHGEYGDPIGFAILKAHDNGDHTVCAEGAYCD